MEPRGSLTGGFDRQDGSGCQSVADGGRRLRVGRERRHADGHGAAGRRSGRHRQLGIRTVSGVQLLSVLVVTAVEPRDRAHR